MGRTLACVMAAVESDLQAEFRTIPGSLDQVLGSPTLHRRYGEPAKLTSLIQKGCDLIGVAHR